MYQNRIAKWDNVKQFLIFCVVVGHTIYYVQNASQLAKALYLFLYSFHMPVFLFVAGLFSKRTIREKRTQRIVEYLVIYVVMKFLEALGDQLAKGSFSFHFLWESGPAWFALALAVFLFVTMLIQNVPPKFLFLSAVLVGCVAGLDTHFGDHFASMRICVFYPVFLAGFYMNPEWFHREWRTKPRRLWLCLTSLLLFGGWLVFCIWNTDTVYPLLKLFKGKYEYREMGYGLEGVLIRLGCYLFWAVMICVVLFLADEKQRIATWLGERTMSVFIWHNLVIVLLFRVWHGTERMLLGFPNLFVPAAICVAGVITVLCAYLPQIRIPQTAGQVLPKQSEEEGEGYEKDA